MSLTRDDILALARKCSAKRKNKSDILESYLMRVVCNELQSFWRKLIFEMLSNQCFIFVENRKKKQARIEKNMFLKFKNNLRLII